jgi:hypothetical protein
VTINRIYKLVLVLSISLQLSMFFIGATVSLFLDQLFNGWAGHLAGHSTLYKIGFIITWVVCVLSRNYSITFNNASLIPVINPLVDAGRPK